MPNTRPATQKHQQLLRVNDTAIRLGVSTKTVRRLIERGELHHHRIGTGEKQIIRVSDEDLRSYINGTRQ